jgi:hypothetical protein
MADDSTPIRLSRSDLREIAGYAVACARPALAIFERERPDDRRPRAALDAAQVFAGGGEQTKALRDSAWAALRAAQEARDAGQAAARRARAATRRAAFLHHIAQSRTLAHPVVVDVLRRYPAAPPGGGRVGELIRQLDASLR